MWLFYNFTVRTDIFHGCIPELESYPQYSNWSKVGFYSFESASSKYFHFIAAQLIFVIYFNGAIM